MNYLFKKFYYFDFTKTTLFKAHLPARGIISAPSAPDF